MKQIHDGDREKRRRRLTRRNLSAIINGKETERFGFDTRYCSVKRRADRRDHTLLHSQLTAVVLESCSTSNPRHFQRKCPARRLERQLPHGNAPADAVRAQSSLSVPDRDRALQEERQWFYPKTSLR